jgi:C4-dicarboxylate-specific signal transduction histidine kinase
LESALRRSEKLAMAGRLAASVMHEINNPSQAIAAGIRRRPRRRI